jgi:hypothetical protein
MCENQPTRSISTLHRLVGSWHWPVRYINLSVCMRISFNDLYRLAGRLLKNVLSCKVSAELTCSFCVPN